MTTTEKIIKPIKYKSVIFLSQVVTKYNGNKPIVFWDTCALLDILNFYIIQEKDSSSQYDFYQNILQEIKEGRILSVTSQLVYKEFMQHFKEMYKKIAINEKSLKNVYLEYADTLPQAQKKGLTRAANQLNIVPVFDKLIRDIWKSTIIIKEQQSFQNNAHYRVVNKIPPAAVKGEYKDCYIWTTFVSLSNALKKRYSSHPEMFFITSNAKDFQGPQNQNVGVQLECDRFGLTLCLTIESLWNQYQAYLHSSAHNPAPAVTPAVVTMPSV